MSRLNTRPKLLGNIKGLANTAIAVAVLVHSKPILPFILPAQVFVDADNQIVPNATIADGLDVAMIGVQFHVQINPQKLTPALNNHLAACTARYQSATGITSAVLQAQANPNAPTRKITREDLPDSTLLVSVLEEQDNAADNRLLAMVDVDDSGNTLWDYVDKDGNTPNLSADFLKRNPQVGEALQNALGEWLGFSRQSLAAATPTKKLEDGTTEWTSATPAPSSSASPGNSSALETTANPTG